MKHSYAAILRNLIPVFFIFGPFSGCKVFDPAEEIPSYLHIDSISLTTSGLQGSASENITEAWVFMDGDLIGGFELPATIPILAEGSHHFIIRAGVKMNGDAGTRAIYPFYKGWEGDLTLTRTQADTIEPNVTYFPAIDFTNTLMEDFDGATGNTFGPNPPYTTPIVADTTDAYEGANSGYVHLDATNIQFVGASNWPGPLVATDEVWLEMNYKCNADMTVGVFDVNYNQYYGAVSLGATSEWTKIYIRLSDAIATDPATNSDFKVYIGMFKPSDVAAPYLRVDNLKLLKF